MSLSNPNENGTPNPASRWFEWNGEKGQVRYYDKDAKENVVVALPFTFILMDKLASVRGWHDASSSGIYSNLVKDTTKDVLVVKSFKGGTLAEGLYKDIKDRVNAAGGHYTANCYTAFKSDDGLKVGVLQFKGAALGAWMEFGKQAGSDIYKKAVVLHGTTEGKKGRVVFYTPQFKLTDIAPETLAAAVKLDKGLQEWLTGYLSRNTRQQAEQAGRHVSDEEMGSTPDGYPEDAAPITDDDIPF